VLLLENFNSFFIGNVGLSGPTDVKYLRDVFPKQIGTTYATPTDSVAE